MKKEPFPKETAVGMTLISISIFLNLVTFFIIKNFTSFSGSIWDIIIFLFPFLFSLFLICKIYKRKRWARNLYLIFVAIEILEYVLLLIYSPPAVLILLLIKTFSRLTEAIGVVYLFKNKSQEWFETRKKEIPKKLKRNHTKKIIIVASFIVFMTLLYILFKIISPEEIVNKIGIENGYLIGFIVSFFGGFSSVTGVAFYSVLTALLAGGLNPILLGIVAGTSLSLGDMLMFYLGNQGRGLATNTLDKEIKYVSNFLKEKKLEKFIPFFGYVYIGFTPLPNDWLVLFLAAIEYPTAKAHKIIILGDYTFVLIFTFLLSRGITLFA